MKTSKIIVVLLAYVAFAAPMQAADIKNTESIPQLIPTHKAPRPNAINVPVAPTNTAADNEAIVGLLNSIKSGLDACCDNSTSQIGLVLSALAMDSASTWTVLGNFNTTTNFIGSDVAHALDEMETDILETFTTTTQILEIALTFTGLPQEIIDTVTSLATFTINVNILPTYTILGDFNTTTFFQGSSVANALDVIQRETIDTFTTINSDFNSTWSILQADFNSTWTLITANTNATFTSLASGFNGTFSAIQADFYETWSLLGDVSCLGAGASITGTLCNIMQTINADFNGTFSTLNADFQGTWSLITTSSGSNAADFQGTYSMLQTIINEQDGNGTFTVLGEIGSILGNGATISGTLLSIYNTVVSDANGTFSTIQADFNGTWSLLGDISCLSTGATITGTLCNIMQTLNDDFSGTFSVLNTGFQSTWSLITANANGTFSSIAAGFNGTFSTLNADFQGTYSMLQSFINDSNGTFSVLNADFQGTWSLIVADANGTFSSLAAGFNGTFSTLNTDFQGSYSILQNIINDENGTFTVLGEIGSTLGKGATISGTLLTIYNTIVTDANGTYSAIQADFNDTWSLLGNVSCLGTGATITGTLCNIIQTITSDFQSTFTALNADFQGTWSLLVADANGTFSSLAAGFNGTFSTLSTDFQGTYSILQNFTFDANGTFSVLNADFQGTWSLLVADAHSTFSSLAVGFNGTFSTLNTDFQDTYSILQTIINDENGTFTALGEIGSTLGRGATISGTLLSIYDAIVASSGSVDLQGTYSMLQTIINDEQGTFTIFGEIGSTLGQGATISGTLLSIYNTMINDSNGTFSTIQADFNDTWSILGNVSCLGTGATITGTLCNIMQNINNDFSGTFSTLNADFQGTWSLLVADTNNTFSSLASGFNGTFSTLSTDFQGTYSMLQTLINDEQGTFSTLNADFQGTWSILQADFNGTWSIIVFDFAGTYSTLPTIINTLQGTFSALNADSQGTWSILQADFNGTWSLLVSDFAGTFSLLNTVVNDELATFTILGNVGTILGQGATISGTLFDIAETTTVLYQNIHSPSVINPSPFTTTFVISQPGRYIVPNNLTFSPATPQPAILITTNQVELDFLGSKLAQGNFISGVHAVAVSSGLTDIYIHNGMIEHWTGAGISIGSGCQRFQIENTLTFSCDTRGIQLNGTVGATITESSIRNCRMLDCCQGPNGSTVLTMNYCTDVNVQDCMLNGNGIITNTLQGIYLANSLKCKFQNVAVNDNVAGSDFRAYDINASTQCTFENCETKNCQALATSVDGNARGFVLENGSGATGNVFSNCVAIGLASSAATDGFLCDANNNNDNLFFDCLASLNTSTNTTGATNGFFVSQCARVELNGCKALYNTALGTVNGIQINECISTIVGNCEAHAQGIYAATTPGALADAASYTAGTIADGPLGIAFSPLTSGFLYAAATNQADNSVTVYSVNPLTGIFTTVASYTVGTNPGGVAYSPIASGDLVAALVNTQDNTVYSYPVTISTGALGTQNSQTTGAIPTSVAFAPVLSGNLYAAVTNSNDSTVSVYSVNPSTAVFTQVGSAVTVDTSPQDIAFSPIVSGGVFAITANEGGSITVLSLNSSGVLTPIGTFFSGSVGIPVSVAFSPVVEGNLYAAIASQGTADAYVFRINQTTGVPTLLQTVSLGDFISSVAFSPLISGDLFAAVTNEGLSSIAIYKVNLTTGLWTAVGAFGGTNGPFTVAFSPFTGNLFAAATNFGTTTITAYQVALPTAVALPGAIGFAANNNSSASSAGCKFNENEATNNGIGFSLNFLSANTDTAFTRNVSVKNSTNFSSNFAAGMFQSASSNNVTSLSDSAWTNIALT